MFDPTNGTITDDNGTTYTHYSGTFQDARPVIQYYLDQLGCQDQADPLHPYWGLPVSDDLVCCPEGRIGVLSGGHFVHL